MTKRSKRIKPSTDNVFTNNKVFFTIEACECKSGSIPMSDGSEIHPFFIKPQKAMLNYIYREGQGLINRVVVEKNKKGGTKEEEPVEIEVMAELSEIKNGDIKALEKFINKHGFFYRIQKDDNDFYSVSLFTIINRLKATILLMSALDAKTKDYSTITALTMYLLFDNQRIAESHDSLNVELVTSERQSNISKKQASTESDFKESVKIFKERYIHKYDVVTAIEGTLPTITDDYCLSENVGAFDNVNALNTGNTIKKCTSEEYDRNKEVTSKSNIEFLYSNKDFVFSSECCRLVINFLYNFTSKVGEILSYNYDGELSFVESDSVQDKIKKDKDLQDDLMNLARYVLKTEIEYNLRDIEPSYDAESLSPVWKVDSLMSALYFTLFNIHSEEKRYRICDKPGCGRYFLKGVTSEKGKVEYCSKNCRGAIHTQKNRKNKQKR